MLRVENNTADYSCRQPQNAIEEPRKILNSSSCSNQNGNTLSGPPLPNVPNISCSRFLCQCLLKGGDQTFLINSANDKRLTYVETFKMVKRASGWFGRRFNNGDVICIYSGNRPHYVTAFLAITAAGGAVCHANSEFTSAELQDLIDSVGNVVAIIAEKNNIDRAIEVARKKDTKIKLLMYTDGSACVPESVASYESVMDGWQEEELVLEDTFADRNTLISGDPKQSVLHILSSSGTTGLPKRVLVSHSARLHNIIQLSDPNFRFCTPKRDDDGEILLLLMPMHLMFATVLWTHALAEGATVVTLSQFKPNLFLTALQEYKCTLLPVVPSLALFLIESPLTETFDLSKLKKVLFGGATVPPSIGEILQRKLKLQSCRQGYGLTETGHVTNLVNNKLNLRSIGSLLPGTEMQVRDLQTNCVLGPNQLGEFWIRGPQVMIGYQRLESIFDENGWLRTGDVGYYDGESEFYFVERLKDILKVKGHQVAPAELENIVLKHPMVFDCAVVGIPDPRAGEYPLAFVVLKSNVDKEQSEETAMEDEYLAKDIQNFVASRTCRMKHLTGGVRFVAKIPRTQSGKTLRIFLRRLLQSEKEKQQPSNSDI